MTNYIRAELYRLSHKKSTYYLYGILTTLFLAIMVFANFESSNSFVMLGATIAPIIMMIVFIQSFGAVYSDDISSKTLGNIISTGLPRTKMILSKAIILVIHTLTVGTFLSLVFGAYYLIIGGRFGSMDASAWEYLGLLFVLFYAATFAFSLLASIVTYSTQSSALGTTTLVMLSLGFIHSILSLLAQVFTKFAPLLEYTITHSTSKYSSIANYGIIQPIPSEYWLLIAGYVVASIALSAIIFNRKEISV